VPWETRGFTSSADRCQAPFSQKSPVGIWWQLRYPWAKIDELAREVRFTGAITPQAHDERIEVMRRPVGAAYALDTVRVVARLLDGPDVCLAPELNRAADTLERIIRARS
jgi:hypothetical protein